jgi:hypothetical protein
MGPTTAFQRRIVRFAVAATAIGAATALSTLAGASAPVTATPDSFSVNGSIIGITAPIANGLMWILSGNGHKRDITQVNVDTHKVLGGEPVNRYADSIALSSNDATVALGTTKGKYPAEVWYSALTGRYSNSAPSPSPVYQVATNTGGYTIYALRGTVSQKSVFALGTANQLGLNYPLPVNAVAMAPTPAPNGMLILQPSGEVGHLNLRGGVYINQFATGLPASAMALSPDGTTLYVLRAASSGATLSTIAEVNVASGSVLKTLTVHGDCVSIAVSSDGHTLYEAIRSAKSSIEQVAVP